MTATEICQTTVVFWLMSLASDCCTNNKRFFRNATVPEVIYCWADETKLLVL